MTQPAQDIYQFHLQRSSYMRIGMLCVLALAALLLGAFFAVLFSSMLWPTYTHAFTLYLKWQDAVMFLLCFLALFALGGSIFILRFLYALYCGYKKGMLLLVKDGSLTVRDLAPENLMSVFWMLNSAFWCCMALLAGLLPEMLLGWTIHLTQLPLAILATAITLLLGLAGLVVSVVAALFILMGSIGVITSYSKLGGSQTYSLSSHAVLRIDNYVLTIIYPGTPETMLDLKLLSEGDARLLLSLLQEYWVTAQYSWNPAQVEEIEAALKKTSRHIALA